MDIDHLRKETKGTQNVIHFNNAGASLMADPVGETVREYMEQEACYGSYETAVKNAARLHTFYTVAAQLINANPEEIAFVESASVAWNRAFYSIPLEEGDVLLTGGQEYASNYITFLQRQKRDGFQIKIVANSLSGEIDAKALEEMIDERVKLIALTHIPTQTGMVNPAEEIGQVAKKYGITYLLDSCQSVGQYPIDVEKIHCDFLTATGRKYLRGPRGTGFLYARQSTTQSIEPHVLDLSSATWCDTDDYEVRNDARKFETWERSPAGQIGLTHAIEYLNGLGISSVWERISELARQMREKLQSLEKLQVQDEGLVRSGIVSFTVQGMQTGAVKTALHFAGINVSIAYQSASLIDMRQRQLPSIIRASVHYYNTTEEIDTFIAKLKDIIPD